MKKILLISLSALMLLSSLTACGSKNDSDNSSETYTRQLYNSDDTAVKSDEDEEDEKTETEKDKKNDGASVGSRTESKEKKKDADNKTSSSNSSKSNTYTISANTSSKKSTSSVASVKPAESSRAATSESIITSRTESAASSEATSSEESSKASSADDTETITDTQTDTEKTDDTDSTVIVPDFFTESDLICTYKDINIKAGSDINILIAKIGLPYNVDTEPRDDNEELVNKTYYFEGMEVKTNPNEDGSMDYIISMKVDDEAYKTVKGAKIGMDIDDVIEIYGEDYAIAYDMFQYEIDGMILGFDTKNGFVISINYIYEKKDSDTDTTAAE